MAVVWLSDYCVSLNLVQNSPPPCQTQLYTQILLIELKKCILYKFLNVILVQLSVSWMFWWNEESSQKAQKNWNKFITWKRNQIYN